VPKIVKATKKPEFLGKHLLFITAHPDDETFSSAGTIALNNTAGGKTWVVCATSGEKGSSHLAKPVSEAGLKRMREAELRAVAKLISIQKIFFLRFPDTLLNKHSVKFYKKSLGVAKQFDPEYIFSFGPDGGSGHLDHITAHKVSARIAGETGARLVNFAFSSNFKTRHLKNLMARRAKGRYIPKLKPLKANCVVPIDYKFKMKAASLHASQFNGSNPMGQMPKTVTQKIFSTEQFYIYPKNSVKKIRKRK
jgi:LmbE family N-acetylglucosaminyl deacetylase